MQPSLAKCPLFKGIKWQLDIFIKPATKLCCIPTNPAHLFTDCGGSYTNASGFLTSPSYPNPYTSGRDCVYLISQPNGKYVYISVISMDVNCQEYYSTSDFIEVRDGNSWDSPLMGRFCGDGSNVAAFMQTTQNHLWIRWRRGTC